MGTTWKSMCNGGEKCSSCLHNNVCDRRTGKKIYGDGLIYYTYESRCEDPRPSGYGYRYGYRADYDTHTDGWDGWD